MLYEVIVGNIGTVHSGSNKKEALKHWKTYVAQSKSGVGRAGNESVTLMIDGEIDSKHDYEPSMQLWARFGDTGDYTAYDDLDAFIEDCRASNIGTGVRFITAGSGFETDSYSGKNYISCYWGDADAQKVHDLSEDEKRQIKEAIDGK
jgi:hypothetical protein